MVKQLGTDLGLSASALARVPPDAGEVTLMRSDQLSAAQTAVQAVRVLSALLLVLVLGMFALAIYLARGQRRETLRNIGWAFVLVGLIVLVVRRVGGSVAVDTLTTPASRSRPSGVADRHRDPGRDRLGGDPVRRVALLGALLAGPSRPAVAVRSRIAPVLNDQPGIAWAVVAFVFLLAIVWGGTHALRRCGAIALLGALLAAGVLAFRHQTKSEAAVG